MAEKHSGNCQPLRSATLEVLSICDWHSLFCWLLSEQLARNILCPTCMLMPWLLCQNKLTVCEPGCGNHSGFLYIFCTCTLVACAMLWHMGSVVVSALFLYISFRHINTRRTILLEPQTTFKSPRCTDPFKDFYKRNLSDTEGEPATLEAAMTRHKHFCGSSRQPQW